MSNGRKIVLDIGKTLAKLSLWDRDGSLVAREVRRNCPVDTGGYIALDVDGIEAWMAGVLEGFAAMGPVDAIIPVGHGAAAAIVRDGRLVVPPLDYEEPVSAGDRAQYDRLRDPFAVTGSPALPDGLNLGAQLYRLGKAKPGLFDGAQIITWPQYWAWRLSGVAASEVTSLGCHSDLWRPMEQRPTELAEHMGWAAALAPVRGAGEALGTITPEWAARTGLPETVNVHCGLHDSNAALLAARGFPELAGRESTVLSTGTWFIAMRTPGDGAVADISGLPETRDCLVNVDVLGRPVPSARFMGGREIETLVGVDAPGLDAEPDQAAMIAAVPAVLAMGAMVVPTFAPGVGPFPRSRGRWIARPEDSITRRAAVCLYAALVADSMLELIGAGERLLIEGRFARAEPFVRALAALRPDMAVYVFSGHNDVSIGALRLLDSRLAPAFSPEAVAPLEADLADYKARWRREAVAAEGAGA